MKSSFIVVLALLLVAIPIAVAGSFDTLRVDHIAMPYSPVYSDYPVRVYVGNEGLHTAQDIHVRSFMPFYTDRGYGQINEIAGSDVSRTVMQSIDSLPKGEYWVRITVSNDNERRVKHRLVTIG